MEGVTRRMTLLRVNKKGRARSADPPLVYERFSAP
jgi:hypothetical protein